MSQTLTAPRETSGAGDGVLTLATRVRRFAEQDPYRVCMREKRFGIWQDITWADYWDKVELGRALAMEPKLLLLDEPVAGMNAEETEDMARFILDIRSELDTAMILVEHDMGLVMDLADRVMVLDFGQRIALGGPKEVQADPAVIKAYLGEPEVAP